jgi:hypothetical protein
MPAKEFGLLEDSEDDEMNETAVRTSSQAKPKQARKDKDGAASSQSNGKTKKVTTVMKDHKTLFGLILKQLLAVDNILPTIANLENVQLKIGRPPAGYMERELAD